MRRVLVAAALLVVSCGREAPPDGAAITALVGATVIDVVAAREIPDATILIRDDRILAVGDGEAVPVPDGATIVNLEGRWIIPGLIDVHTHLQPWGLALSLEWGVTTVRELHSGFSLDAVLSTSPAGTPVPRRFSAVAMLDGAPSTYSDAVVVESPEGASGAVGTVADSAADWIKTYTRITPGLLEAIVTAARARRLPVTAHLGLTDAVTAVRLGVRSIEHLSGIPEVLDRDGRLAAAHRRGFFAGWTAFEQSWLAADTAELSDVARQLAATGVILVPTLGLHEIFSRLDDSTVYRRADLAGVPDTARANWDVPGMLARAGWNASDLADFRMARAIQDALVREFVAAGGRVATGTDASNQLLVPGAGVHLEMELLVAAGVPTIEALRAATMHAADLLLADSLGRLRANAMADLVVLNGDPIRQILHTRRVERVMLGGRWVRE